MQLRDQPYGNLVPETRASATWLRSHVSPRNVYGRALHTLALAVHTRTVLAAATVPCEDLADSVDDLATVDTWRILTQNARILHPDKSQLGRCGDMDLCAAAGVLICDVVHSADRCQRIRRRSHLGRDCPDPVLWVRRILLHHAVQFDVLLHGAHRRRHRHRRRGRSHRWRCPSRRMCSNRLHRLEWNRLGCWWCTGLRYRGGTGRGSIRRVFLHHAVDLDELGHGGPRGAGRIRRRRRRRARRRRRRCLQQETHHPPPPRVRLLREANAPPRAAPKHSPPSPSYTRARFKRGMLSTGRSSVR